MISKKDKKIQFSEYQKHFAEQVENADKARVDSLQRLQTIRSKRQISQQRQLNRLTEKYGEKDPKVIRQAERIVGEKEMASYLSISLNKTEGETDVIKDNFVLKGRILDKDTNGVSGLTVQLQDEKNNLIGKPSVSDKYGIYSLVINVDESYRMRKVVLVVLDKKGTKIHQDKLPVLLKVDAIEYRDIVLAEGEVTKPTRPVTSKADKNQATTKSRSVKK